MKRDRAETEPTSDPDETRRRLSSEVAEVESAISMVVSGAASRITLTGLMFGEELARRFRADAEPQGIRLEPILWPEDTGCDLIVRRIDE
jgi:hypothetical protein